MPRPASTQPTDGELEILRAAWAAGPTSLSVLCEALRQDRDVAATEGSSWRRQLASRNIHRDP